MMEEEVDNSFIDVFGRAREKIAEKKMRIIAENFTYEVSWEKAYYIY
jgi:hypothetical protein